MKPSVTQLENLLTLRRAERPDESYWQDFLCEFHHRQREKAVESSGLKAWFRKSTDWVSAMGFSKWSYLAGLTYATVIAAIILVPRNSEVENTPASPVNFQAIPSPVPTVEQLEQLDLSPSTQGSVDEKAF